MLRKVLGAGLALAMAGALAGELAAAPDSMVIVGATLVDLEHGGTSHHDRPDSVLVIRAGKIVAAGPRARVRLPHGLPVVDAHGGFVIPGLIDGYGSLRNEDFARAYLYNGVTAVQVSVGSGDDDAEARYVTPRLGPRVLRGQTTNGDALPPPSGLRVLQLTKDADPAAVARAGAWARAHGLAVSAILGRTPYAGDLPVQVLLRNDHYLTSVAGPALQSAYAGGPRAAATAGPAYRAICDTDVHGAAVARLAGWLNASHIALMPMQSVEASADDLGIDNPWHAASASLIALADIDDPVDPASGAHPYLDQHPARRDAIQACARRREAADAELHRRGVRFLAGSGSPAYGVLPGSGLRQELALLQRSGLTPRESLAAATTSFADVFGWRDVGRVAPGYVADLLILKRNPALDLSALDEPAALLFGGRVIDRRRLLVPVHSTTMKETQ